MDNDEPDLPGDIADALRDVPPAEPAVKDAHIAAALSAWASETDRSARVTALDSRRRLLLSTAAALLLVVGAGIGWMIHSPGATPVAADVSVGSAAQDSSTEAVPTSTVAKGGVTHTATAVPQCTNEEFQPIDSVYVGEYRNTMDGKTYLVFTFNGTLEFVDKDTCQSVNLVPGTTTP